MPDATPRVRRFPRLVWAAIVLLVIAGDQITKSMVAESIAENAVVPVVQGFFNLTNTGNTGVVFGIFSDSPAPWKTALLILVQAALIALIVGFIWRSRRLPCLASAGLALALGGALSNLVDRIRMGQVLDFFDFYWRGYHWPAFNLADSAIVVGAILLAVQILFVSE